MIASYDTETRSRLKATTKKSLMYGNETSLEELLVIFIDNALKYSPPESPVEIKVREKRLHAEIQVRNQGEPIPPEQQARLFERFYRGDNSRTASDSRGYGLGLAIAKRIVDIHHGSIKVDSSRKKGTCFSISLPTSKTTNPKLKQSPKH
ncbi:hypothetical protein B7Y94_01295 [Candidatus Saccharibacteria bacterium 32-49-12]|nr:MAG: hypothetical protein B7Y94_01295 [Candidatus Saccharibacteria bacterium 32-49-12]